MPSIDILKVKGTDIVDKNGNAVYPGREYQIRDTLTKTIGPEKANFYFDKFLEYFFRVTDAKFYKNLGLNCITIPFNSRHFEDDMNPRVLKPEDFIWLAGEGTCTILDMHTVPGGQNADWHSDSAHHVAEFCTHKDFQGRAIWLWEQLATHYKSNPFAGYNTLNEPCDPIHSSLQQCKNNLPIWNREFGHVYTREMFDGPGWEETNKSCILLLRDQLEVYDQQRIPWSTWLYKNIETQYIKLFKKFLLKKLRLAIDAWEADSTAIGHIYTPLEYRLARNMLLAEFLIQEWADHFVGLDFEQLDAVAASFKLEHCVQREELNKTLVMHKDARQ
ncbi:glycoside hydrolase superfamily [Kalaharituber pfeilii]|nr:glycoside hydrolase superfamily [Kalaharituber pfeilii]